jgi:hypothetical protein
MNPRFPIGRAAHAFVLAALLFAGQAVASGRHAAPAANPAWQAECGTCHIAYPPGLLPAASWRALMGDLTRHFGTDASVDEATAAAIGAFLERHAGAPRPETQPAALRITETRWFTREHAEVPARVWRSASVGSAANCAACHRGAESGRFGEHDVRIPR